MRLLIGYDGSDCSEAALDDLVQAGLPETGEALLLSVAEVWLPPRTDKGSDINLDPQHEEHIKSLYEKGEEFVAEARTLTAQAKQRLQNILPKWEINAEATYGSPAWELLSRADEFKPDLIVVGSHGRTALGRMVLGSISQKILTEAACSVRVARGRIEVDPTPMRLIIGFDGSKGAQAAIEAVAARHWREQSEIRLIAVTDPITPSVIGRFIPPINRLVEEANQSEIEWIKKLAATAMESLQAKGVSVDLHIYSGSPKQILIEEAERWQADCIFVGANAFGSRLERFLVGSTSSAVAARAGCTVEVVRKNRD